MGKLHLLELLLVPITNVIVQKIKARIQTQQSRQKCYADLRHKDLELKVGDHVFLKVAPMRGVVRFGKKGNLSPRFIDPFAILKRIGPVAYRLVLPLNLYTLHIVFHVFMLWKYTLDPLHVLTHDMLSLREDLTYKEDLVQI